MQVADFRAFVTLPYSEDGFGMSVVSRHETVIPKAQWDQQKKHGVILLSDDYKLLRKSIQDNCQVLQCQQIVGQFDELFQVIDENLKLIPWNSLP